MTAERLKALCVLALAVVAMAGAHAWRPSQRLADTRPKTELSQLFPRAFADWSEDRSMPAQLVSPDVQAALDRIYNQTLSRTYVNANGQRIMLSVAYGGDQSDATRAHRPEVCYPTQGFQILSSAKAAVSINGQSVAVRRLVAQQGSRYEPITYWIIVGEQVTATVLDQKLAQLTYSMRGLIPDGMLVRVSSIDRDDSAAFALHERFIAQLAAAVPEARHARIFGHTARVPAH